MTDSRRSRPSVSGHDVHAGIPSSFGVWKFSFSNGRLSGISLPPLPGGIRADFSWEEVPRAGREVRDILAHLLAQIEEYFSRKRRIFHLPLKIDRSSSFAGAVWNAMRKIPYGKVMTYGEIASSLGRPGAARAVGRACGRNRLPLIIPCHRVVGARGLGGFSSGREWKRLLLRVEGVFNNEVNIR